VATAHPAKFRETIENITKVPYVLPETLELLLQKPLRVTDMTLNTMADDIAKMIQTNY